MARFVWIVIGCFLFASAYAATETEESDLRQVTRIAKAFAESHILGTGANQYLTRVRDISGKNATVFLGQSDETSDDPEAYKANLEKIGGKWKVVTYEFGKIGNTGDLKRVVRRVDMHGSLYPSLEFDRLVESNGGSGYYKQFPNDLDGDEAPISKMQRSRFITIDIIKKHKTEGVVIGGIQRGKKAETLIDVYGRTENDVSKYLQDISAELPLVTVVDVSPLDACSKSIVKARLLVTANQEQLSVPENQDVTKISFDIEGKSFDCTLEEVASSRAKGNEGIVNTQQFQQ